MCKKHFFSCSNWKILHLAKFFYTTSGCDSCDKYEVWFWEMMMLEHNTFKLENSCQIETLTSFQDTVHSESICEWISPESPSCIEHVNLHEPSYAFSFCQGAILNFFYWNPLVCSNFLGAILSKMLFKMFQRFPCVCVTRFLWYISFWAPASRRSLCWQSLKVDFIELYCSLFNWAAQLATLMSMLLTELLNS